MAVFARRGVAILYKIERTLSHLADHLGGSMGPLIRLDVLSWLSIEEFGPYFLVQLCLPNGFSMDTLPPCSIRVISEGEYRYQCHMRSIS